MKDEVYVGALFSEDYLAHYGVGHLQGGHSGRYPWGSGKDPKQRNSSKVTGELRGSKKYAKAPDLHNKQGSNWEAYKMALNVALDIATLNPAGAALDAVRLGQYASSKAKANKISKRQSKEEIDKKTGFHKKLTEMTADEDVKSVNPNFYNFNSNTKNNCMLCTVTYDIRRRGYDVTAELAGKGYQYNDLKRWYPKANIVDIKGSGQNAVKTALIGDKQLVLNTKREIEKQPNGSRGNLMVQWSDMQGGHSMAYEVINGKMHIFDGQTGTHYKNPDKILRQCRKVSYARLDNIEPDLKKVKECCR